MTSTPSTGGTLTPVSPRYLRGSGRAVFAAMELAEPMRSLREDRFEDNPQWEPLHRDFHRALIGGCGSRWSRSARTRSSKPSAAPGA